MFKKGPSNFVNTLRCDMAWWRYCGIATRLERAVDGVPTQIHTLKFLTSAPLNPTTEAWSRWQSKNSFRYVLYLQFVRTHTKFGIAIFEIDSVHVSEIQ